jgi:uncharacterized membrane protein
MKIINAIRDKQYLLMATVSMAVLNVVDAEAAAGTDIGDVASGLKTQLNAVGTAINYGMFAAGIFFVGAGLMKMKAAADSNGQQVKYGEGAWRLVVGAGLCAIPAVAGLFQATGGISGGTIKDANGF